LTDEKKPRRYFTEEDQKNVENLPPQQRIVFYQQLGEIAMRIKVAEDTWENTRVQIDKDLDALIGEIHKALEQNR
jgi:hypothetical protein